MVQGGQQSIINNLTFARFDFWPFPKLKQDVNDKEASLSNITKPLHLLFWWLPDMLLRSKMADIKPDQFTRLFKQWMPLKETKSMKMLQIWRKENFKENMCLIQSDVILLLFSLVLCFCGQ